MTPNPNLDVIYTLQETAVGLSIDADHAILHLACAMARMCDSREEARAVAAFAFSGVRQLEDASFDPNVIMMGDYRVTSNNGDK